MLGPQALKRMYKNPSCKPGLSAEQSQSDQDAYFLMRDMRPGRSSFSGLRRAGFFGAEYVIVLPGPSKSRSSSKSSRFRLREAVDPFLRAGFVGEGLETTAKLDSGGRRSVKGPRGRSWDPAGVGGTSKSLAVRGTKEELDIRTCERLLK